MVSLRPYYRGDHEAEERGYSVCEQMEDSIPILYKVAVDSAILKERLCANGSTKNELPACGHPRESGDPSSGC